HILGLGAEAGAEFLRGKPAMIVAGGGILLLGEEVLQFGFGLGGHLQASTIRSIGWAGSVFPWSASGRAWGWVLPCISTASRSSTVRPDTAKAEEARVRFAAVKATNNK